MGVPTRNTKEMKVAAVSEAMALWKGIKSPAQAARAKAAVGLTGAEVDDLCKIVVSNMDRLAVIQAIPGIGQAFTDQVADYGGNIGADSAAVLTAGAAVRDWIIANWPVDGDGYLLWYKRDGAGRLVDRTFPAPALAGLVAALDALIATID